MSNEIAVYALKDMQTMAEAVAKSGLFGMKSADQALALMLVAQSENQHPATITQDYDIIQGKACRKTHSVMARFQQMGGKVEWHQLTDTIADATFSHPSGGSLRIEWTIEQAKKANLTGKDNWKNYPRAMLRARVIAEGVRAVYPAAIGGMMIAEEAADVPMYSAKDEIKGETIDGSTDEIKPIKVTPKSAASANVPDGFDQYEADVFPVLQEAAKTGMVSLTEEFGKLSKSANKAAFWTKHSSALKEAAEKADANIIDAEVVK